MTTNPHIPGDVYHTPADLPRDLMDRLCLGGSAWYYHLFSRVIVRSRSEALAGTYDLAAWAQASRDIMEALERCGARFHIDGLEHVRQLDRPAVFISNHMSTVETVVFPCLIAPYRPATYVVKHSLTTMPIFGPVMRSRDPIAVGRTNPREDMQKVLTEGQAKLEDGTSIIIFPQSTRQIVFAPDKFNSLGVKLARRAGVPVVPVAIKTDFWAPGTLIKDFGPLKRELPIHIRFGAPMEVEGNGREQHQAIVDFIVQNLAEWNAALTSTNGPS